MKLIHVLLLVGRLNQIYSKLCLTTKFSPLPNWKFLETVSCDKLKDNGVTVSASKIDNFTEEGIEYFKIQVVEIIDNLSEQLCLATSANVSIMGMTKCSSGNFFTIDDYNRLQIKMADEDIYQKCVFYEDPQDDLVAEPIKIKRCGENMLWNTNRIDADKTERSVSILIRGEKKKPKLKRISVNVTDEPGDAHILSYDSATKRIKWESGDERNLCLTQKQRFSGVRLNKLGVVECDSADKYAIDNSGDDTDMQVHPIRDGVILTNRCLFSVTRLTRDKNTKVPILTKREKRSHTKLLVNLCRHSIADIIDNNNST